MDTQLPVQAVGINPVLGPHSTNPRALQTIAHLGVDYCPMSALNNVDTGGFRHESCHKGAR